MQCVCPQLHRSDTFVHIVCLIVNGHYTRHFVVEYLLDNVRTDFEIIQPGRESTSQIVWCEMALVLCLLINCANLIAHAPTLQVCLHGCLGRDTEDLTPTTRQ